MNLALQLVTWILLFQKLKHQLNLCSDFYSVFKKIIIIKKNQWHSEFFQWHLPIQCRPKQDEWLSKSLYKTRTQSCWSATPGEIRPPSHKHQWATFTLPDLSLRCDESLPQPFNSKIRAANLPQPMGKLRSQRANQETACDSMSRLARCERSFPVGWNWNHSLNEVLNGVKLQIKHS